MASNSRIYEKKMISDMILYITYAKTKILG